MRPRANAGGQPVPRALRHQRVLEFRNRTEDSEVHAPDRGRGVNALNRSTTRSTPRVCRKFDSSIRCSSDRPSRSSLVMVAAWSPARLARQQRLVQLGSAGESCRRPCRRTLHRSRPPSARRAVLRGAGCVSKPARSRSSPAWNLDRYNPEGVRSPRTRARLNHPAPPAVLILRVRCLTNERSSADTMTLKQYSHRFLPRSRLAAGSVP